MTRRPFREQDLLFFGATTASVSHELKNVITIINESAGLLHDFASAAERGRPLAPQRVKKTSLDISRNVERAVGIIDRLNRFAHSADEPVRPVDIQRLVHDAVALAGRTAGLRGRQIDARVPDEPVTVSTYAFGLHQAVFQLLRLAGLTPSTSPVTASLAKAPGGAVIRIAPVPVEPSAEADALLAEVQARAAELGATTARGADGTFELHVPDGVAVGPGP